MSTMASTSPQRVCGYSLVIEGTPDPFLNYDGSVLRRCKRCKGVNYTNQDAQKKHWKKHKKCCRLLDTKDSEKIAQLSLDKCSDDIKKWICNGNGDGGMETYYHIKRLRELFDDDDADGCADAVAFKLHAVARGLIFNGTDHMLTVVASPNMAQLLFGDEEDLLNDKTRLVKHQLLAKYNGRPSEEAIEDIEDEGEREALRKICDTYDDFDDSSWGQPSSMSFCYFYFNLIVACAIHGNASRSSFDDGCGRLRGGDPRNKSAEGLLSTAALRRAMTLWTDPHVLASCGDAMAPAASLALTAVNYYETNDMLGGTLCRKHELIPGLSIDCAVMTCMGELLEKAGSAQYSIKLLKTLGGIVRKTAADCWDAKGVAAPWTDLPIERRAKVLLATIRYVTDDRGDEDPFGGGRLEMPSDEVNDIFKTISGMQNPNDKDLAQSVWQKAADDGECIGPEAVGHNAETRAFLYYLLRRNSPSNEWESLDLVKLIKDFGELPRIHRAPDNAKVKEKDECMRLAYGDKRHEEMNAIFRP